MYIGGMEQWNSWVEQLLLLKDPESGPVTAFTKNEQDNLSDNEKKVLKKLVKSLKEEAEANRKGGRR